VCHAENNEDQANARDDTRDHRIPSRMTHAAASRSFRFHEPALDFAELAVKAPGRTTSDVSSDAKSAIRDNAPDPVDE
ncbi:MAG TPA: hypothetical protein PLN52_19480, partial [Opitutaceae bacterium]|nr:hypothetical protein [Opitutaceae bacterium]